MKGNMTLLAGICVFALAFALVAAAQEPAKVGGTWEMTIEGPQGTMTQTLTIEQNGGKIKGTLKGQRGESPVEGTVDGNKIDFTAKRQTPNGERIMQYTGTMDGDSIKGTVKFGPNDREWTAKRSK